MRSLHKMIFRGVLVAAICLLACRIQPAVATDCGEPFRPARDIEASWATSCARYYAPYALQAAIAYVSVTDLDGTLRNFDKTKKTLKKGDPSLDGSDVDLAMRTTFPLYQTDEAVRAIKEQATKYLRGWQYQFGSDAYLTCIDASDTACNNAYNASWRYSISTGPVFQVWARTRVTVTGTAYRHTEHEACSEVSIAFRGTEVAGDWYANAEPVGSFGGDDSYRQLQRNIDTIIKQITDLDCYKHAAAHRIVSVGHSLGGGLAQLAALATKKGGPHISKVFAFDSTPVTGSNLVKADVLKANAERLTIDRIHQEGEIISKYLPEFQFPSSSSPCKPLVRNVTYAALPSRLSSRGLHSMAGLAGEVVELSYSSDYRPPPAPPGGCDTEYNAPARDDDETPVPSTNPAEQVYYAPNGTPARLSQARQYGARHPLASEQGGATSTLPQADSHKFATALFLHRGRKIHAARS
jgi:pimeloyl-ACP methyl ester carboxylesterase